MNIAEAALTKMESEIGKLMASVLFLAAVSVTVGFLLGSAHSSPTFFVRSYDGVETTFWNYSDCRKAEENLKLRCQIK